MAVQCPLIYLFWAMHPALVRAAHEAEVAGRIATKPIGDLATDFPGANPANFGVDNSGSPIPKMTLYALHVDDTAYVGGYATRAGNYPFPASMVVPSYSTAKTFFAALSALLLEQNFGGVFSSVVGTVLGEGAPWNDVTLDMATGNYRFATYMRDEGLVAHDNNFFLADSHQTKIAHSLTYYSRKATPGTKFVYHTTDHYVHTTAIRELLNTLAATDDLIAYLNLAVYGPLGLSAMAKGSIRTTYNDGVDQPWSAWGMFFTLDDALKLARFFNPKSATRGQIDGTQVLHAAQLDAALQNDPSDVGLDANGRLYNNGVWAIHAYDGYAACPSGPNREWVPFASGYGGITIAFIPNGMTYAYFSDDDVFEHQIAEEEAEAIRSRCD